MEEDGRGGCARETELNKLIVRTGSEHALQPFKSDETVRLQFLRDLRTWSQMRVAAGAGIVLNFDAVVLGMRGGSSKLKAEVWLTTYPAPFSQQILTPQTTP